MLAYRSAVQESIGVSPCEMTFGRPIYLPVDLVLGRVEPESNYTNRSEYANKLSIKLSKIHEFARSQLNLSSQNMIREYNSKLHVNKYTPGSAVWVHNKNHSKLGSKWEGPYTVTQKINDVLYKIQKGSRTRPKTVHHNNLKPYRGSKPALH